MPDTTVAIIGAGPAGLLLGRLLSRSGIDTTILERRDRAYVEARQRAGVLEQSTIDVLRDADAAAGMLAGGMRHDGVELAWPGRSHRIDFDELTGRHVMVYPQTAVVADLIALRTTDALPLEFDAEVTAITGWDTDRPSVTYRKNERDHTVRADFVVAADGSHGVSARTLPAGAVRTVTKEYPYSWLGILADIPPSVDELVYARHHTGFALYSMRSANVSRLYLQVDNDDSLDAWSDDRILSTLSERLGRPIPDGEITERSLTPMRSVVRSPMRHGSLFLVGDAAHIVPPAGAKGLNLAAADVTVLADALARQVHYGDPSGIDAFSSIAARRVWRAQQFSQFLTDTLHVAPQHTAFDHEVRIARLEELARSRAASTAFSDNYTGAPISAR